MPKVFYEIGALKLAIKCQYLAFKMPGFGIYEIDAWKVSLFSYLWSQYWKESHEDSQA